MSLGGLPGWAEGALACPGCRGSLDPGEGEMRCTGCETRYPQADARVVDLMPPGWGAAGPDWGRRQREMTVAYDELAADREHSLLAWRSDYGPLSASLSACRGRVLDVGGGNGIARNWLPPDAEYVSLEPSTAWLDQPWSALADAFPCLAEPPPTVRGVAEHLPFAGATFDAALSVWSLNHVSAPHRALAETARVLVPGGRLLLVLDDVPPSLGDLVAGRFPAAGAGERAWLLLRRLLAPVGGWPRQPDHLPLREAALLRRARRRLTLRNRTWIGAYLVLELDRRD